MFEDCSYGAAAFGHAQPVPMDGDPLQDAMAAAAAQMATSVNSSGSNTENNNNNAAVEDNLECTRSTTGAAGFITDHDPSLPQLHNTAPEGIAAMALDGVQHQLGFNLDQAAHEMLLHSQLMLTSHPPADADPGGWAAGHTDAVGMAQPQQESAAAAAFHHHHLFPHGAAMDGAEHLAFQPPLGSYDLNGGGITSNNHYPVDSSSPFASSAAGTAPDMLNFLHLSNGVQGLSSFAGTGVGSPGRRPYPLDIFGDLSAPTGEATMGPGTGSLLYDPATTAPVFLGYGATTGVPPQTHMLRDLFQSMPPSYGMFCGVAGDERDAAVVGGGFGAGAGIFLQEDVDGLRQFDNPVFEFRRGGKPGEKPNYPTEKHRRKQMKDKYNDLMALIPNPSKTDRASIVQDAIDYIQELQREMAELKLLIEKKRLGRAAKRAKIIGPDQLFAAPDLPPSADADPGVGSGATPAADMESTTVRSSLDAATGGLPAVSGAVDRDSTSQLYASALRSTWLQRRSRETSVDVRIVDDEANIKLTQKKKPNCLLLASRALDQLQLDVAHVSGGFIGEHFIFMFNTKIIEGSSVYASAIATKLLEVMDRTYPSPTYMSAY